MGDRDLTRQTVFLAHELQQRGGLLRALLDGESTGPGDEAGMGVAPPTAVVAFEPRDGEGPDDPTFPDRLLNVIWFAAETAWSAAACATVGPVCYALVPAGAAGEPADLARAVSAVVDRVARVLGVALRAGIGSTQPDLAGIAESRRDADRVLDTLRRLDTGPHAAGPHVAHVDDVRADAVLAQMRELVDGWSHLRSPKLAVLWRHDAERGTDYVRTLRAYLDTFGDVRATAEALDVSVPTLRYRLRRLLDLSTLDLADPDERLVCALELSASRLEPVALQPCP